VLTVPLLILASNSSAEPQDPLPVYHSVMRPVSKRSTSYPVKWNAGLYREGKIVDPLPTLVWTLGPGARAPTEVSNGASQ